LIKALGDKLSDKKTKDLVCSLLTALSEAVGPGKKLEYVNFYFNFNLLV